MAGKAKSCYLSVTEIKTHKIVLNKQFLKMADLNEFIKEEKFIEKYPKEVYVFDKEVY